jgi:hypothetical protein
MPAGVFYGQEGEVARACERRRGREALARRIRFARPPAAMTGHARVKHIPRILLQAATPYLTAGGDFLVSGKFFLTKSVSMQQAATMLYLLIAICSPLYSCRVRF